MNALPALSKAVEPRLPNQQWEPERSTIKPGKILPARLRMLTGLTRDEYLQENPIPVVVTSETQLKETITSEGALELFKPVYTSIDPSPIGVGNRGKCPPPKISRDAPPEPGQMRTKAAPPAPPLPRPAPPDPRSILTVVHDSSRDAGTWLQGRSKIPPEASRPIPGVHLFHGTLDRLAHKERNRDPYDDDGDDDDHQDDGPISGFADVVPLPVVDLYLKVTGSHSLRHVEVHANQAVCRTMGGATLQPPPPFGTGGGGATTEAAASGFTVLVTTRKRLRRRALGDTPPPEDRAPQDRGQDRDAAEQKTPFLTQLPGPPASGRTEGTFTPPLSEEGGRKGGLPAARWAEEKRAAAALPRTNASGPPKLRVRTVVFEGPGPMGLELEYSEAEHKLVVHAAQEAAKREAVVEGSVVAAVGRAQGDGAQGGGGAVFLKPRFEVRTLSDFEDAISSLRSDPRAKHSVAVTFLEPDHTEADEE
eukprot:CAMPEP_0172654308 /NCGR_PEP_ID=MMETSP1068-20121228/244268_1 /TAXON_ID=35684 /ORGANISM="Pseudopedinella elastica, Strain CCMP716" /LENGTH=477 /DNA_ID=CAMNT_0013468751 /DNA_START=105 /DNA_END=1535 /DNA_ORIENTATION=+